MRVALLFTDGVGVGPEDPDVNPLARGGLLCSQFEGGRGTPLPHGGRRFDLDTTFGVPGRPQSATNQTAIYTGTDTPVLLGRHLLGFPNQPLRALLAEQSVPKRLAPTRTVSFANAYPAEVLALLGLPHAAPPHSELTLPARAHRRVRASASTLAMAAAGVRFRTLADARRGGALTHDVDGATGRARGLPVPTREPAEAADIFWGLCADFTLFEHFLADEAGHAQDAAGALATLSRFDAFARAVLDRRPADTVVLICSDHGNVEDLRTRNHTSNPVALQAYGLPPELEVTPRTVADVGRLTLQLLGA